MPIACAQAPSEGDASKALPVISGEDNRRDTYDFPEAGWRTLATLSTVGMIDRSRLDLSTPQDVLVSTSPNNLCQGERFYGQQAAAGCSGTLIADDLVLTAGHCITAETCSDLAFVFDFRMADAQSRATVTSDDVYNCQQVVVRQGTEQDYAIVQLDRPVTPEHAPASVMTDTMALPVGTELTIIGHPWGLPTKIADDGLLVQHTGDWFAMGTSLDGNAGNSGSGVFDSAGRLVGIHTHGVVHPDATTAPGESCERWESLSGDADRTGVRYVFFAIRELCSVTDHTLCGSDNPVCGDAVCEPREHHVDCPADCPDVPGMKGPSCTEPAWNATIAYWTGARVAFEGREYEARWYTHGEAPDLHSGPDGSGKPWREGNECSGVCVPQCDGKQCGGDGCGGVCGSCEGNETCNAGICEPVCVPQCDGKQCGGDGCGGVCGSCEGNETCNAGICEPVCVPQCDGKQCGGDGCGGQCGACGTGETCESHQCVPATSGGCDGVNGWQNGTAYAGGARVQSVDALYECKPWPYSGWCGLGSAYEPGVGFAWQDAWTLVGPCQ